MIPRSLRDPDGRRPILDRLAELTPEHPRRWVAWSPFALPHLASGLRLALGERKLEGSPPGRIRGAACVPGRRLFAVARRNIQSPPGAFSTPSLGWERDRQVVVELVERFVTTPPDRLGPSIPVSGG